MTTIAWDGKRLAADRLALTADLKRTVTKIWRLPDSRLLAGSGNLTTILEVKQWIIEGGERDKYPKSMASENEWARVCVVSSLGLHVYERSPIPVQYHEVHFACGSGRDFALTAMMLGKTAPEAVEIASIFDCGTGGGVDWMEL